MRYRRCSTEELKMLNRKAMQMGYNRQLEPDGLDRKADPSGIHILYPLMVHSHAAGRTVDPHVRARVLLKIIGTYEPVPVQLDVSVKDFEALEECDDIGAEL